MPSTGGKAGTGAAASTAAVDADVAPAGVSGWLSWFWSAAVEAEAPVPASKSATPKDVNPSPSQKPMKYKASKVKHMKENAQQAAQARAEKEERKRFLAQQKEMMRQRSSELLALQHKKTPMELERIAKRQAGGGAGAGRSAGPLVVSLGTTSSVERAAITKALESTMTANRQYL